MSGKVSSKEIERRNKYFDEYRKWSKEKRKTAPTYVEWKKNQGKTPKSETYGKAPKPSKSSTKTVRTKAVEKAGGKEVESMSDVAKMKRKKKNER